MNEEEIKPDSIYISQLILKNGQTINIEKNSIVVFVGPNNVGKSQSLKDIYNSCSSNIEGTIIADLKIKKNNVSISHFMDSFFPYTDKGDYRTYNFINRTVNIGNYSDSLFLEDPKLSEYTTFIMANLDTSTRLTICNPPANIRRNGDYGHPIQYAAFNPSYRIWLSNNFKRAFGKDLIPNIQYGGIIPLCIGKPVILTDKFEDEQSRQEKYGEILAKYEQAQNQGDGIKSFVGILLFLMLKNYYIYLIDEPESFLHPPQANIMGKIIGESLSNQQQAFISTHSEELIKGISEVCPNRLKIIRITRNKNENDVAILESQQFEEVWSDPILRYSNIMQSLFHKNVILCESDSDCKMYSIIDNYLKRINEEYSETLFIHCGGKHRIAKIASALQSLKIDVKIIIDLDILDNKSNLKNISSAMGIEWNDIRTEYGILNAHLSSQNTLRRNIIKNKINEEINKDNSDFLSEQEIKNIKNIFKRTSKWELLKKSGSSAIPAGNATNAFDSINKKLSDHNIFMVLDGELENFIKEVGGHGPNWVNAVLSQYPNLEDDVYAKIKKFIKNVNT